MTAASTRRPSLAVLALASLAIIGALNWAADWYKPGRKSPKEIARDISIMVLQGLATKR